jgi:hypothetical protein
MGQLSRGMTPHPPPRPPPSPLMPPPSQLAPPSWPSPSSPSFSATGSPSPRPGYLTSFPRLSSPVLGSPSLNLPFPPPVAAGSGPHAARSSPLGSSHQQLHPHRVGPLLPIPIPVVDSSGASSGAPLEAPLQTGRPSTGCRRPHTSLE